MTDALPSQFDRSFRDTVRGVLRDAYLAAANYYNPASGADAMVHGIVVYKYANLRFREFFRDGTVRHATTPNGAELQAGDLRVRWNKVGSAPSVPIDDSLPRSSLVISEMARQNVQLELPFSGADRAALRASSINWVIAHIGGPQSGLYRIYLAAPVTNGSAPTIRWRECVAIYDAASPREDFPAVGALPEAVPLDDITIELLGDAPVANDREELSGTADG
jgi:hypothetical protein